MTLTDKQSCKKQVEVFHNEMTSSVSVKKSRIRVVRIIGRHLNSFEIGGEMIIPHHVILITCHVITIILKITSARPSILIIILTSS